MIYKYFKILILVGMIGILSPANAQLHLTLDATQNFTNFNFTDSQGETDVDYKGKFLGAYDLGIKVDVYKDLYFRSSIGMRKVGASYITNKVNSEWDLQYMHIELGLVYQHQFESISLFASVSPFYENLVKGNQRLLDINYDVLASDALSNSNFGLSYQGGLIARVNDNFNIKTAMSYSQGLTNIETKNSEQRTTIYAMGLTLGVEFSIL